MKPILVQTVTETEYIPKTLIVSASVRYWEDASINGAADGNGEIPFRQGDLWKPVIDLETGRVIDWPEGIDASVHYKVCDAGEYFLEDESGKRLKWNDYYVPNDLLCVGDNGYGDYIILHILPTGMIKGWKTPEIAPSEWTAV